MLRFFIAIGLVVALAASAFGAAAALTVDGGALQAGQDRDLVCDEDGVYVSAWAVNTYPVLEGVESVKIKGVSPACDGAKIMGRIELNDSDWNDNASWVYTSGTGPYATGYSFVYADGDEDTVYTLYLKASDYTTQVWVPAEKIVGIKLWIEGETYSP